ncbi:MAG: subclass B3 metallo-beta-lactamase [Gemmatimonas sp.]
MNRAKLVPRNLAALLVTLASLRPPAVHAQENPRPTRDRAQECPSCATWNAPHKPLRLYGNTWYVGTNGLSALLITSPSGHVLIDGGLPESAERIAENVEALGFHMRDVKLIVNSHVHYDHAGGIAALQKLSGARVAASPTTARALRKGDSDADDPQYGLTLPFPRVDTIEIIRNNQTLSAGSIRLTALFTGGHTPGGTSWAWVSCDGDQCMNLVYADSQTPISADDFFFTRSKTYPNGIRDFENGFRALERVRCDILITPHPDASGLWERIAQRDRGVTNALIDASACQRYAIAAREKLAKRIATENASKR